MLSNVARELAEENEDLLAYSSTDKALQRRLARAKVARKRFPKLPTSVEEAEALYPADLATTCAGRPFLRKHGVVSFLGGAAWLFISDEGLRLLLSSSIWLVDGTFKLAPLPSYQIFILHAVTAGFDHCSWTFATDIVIVECRRPHVPCCLGLADQEDFGCLP